MCIGSDTGTRYRVYRAQPAAMGRAFALRDLLVLLMVMWIPTSIILFVRHSNQMQADLHTGLLEELKKEARQLDRGENPPPLPISPAPLSGLRGPPILPPEVVESGDGWPTPPKYDPANRAVEVNDLEPSVRNAPWMEVCKTLAARNRFLIEAGELCPLIRRARGARGVVGGGQPPLPLQIWGLLDAASPSSPRLPRPRPAGCVCAYVCMCFRWDRPSPALFSRVRWFALFACGLSRLSACVFMCLSVCD